ncbi:PmoA family protein [Actinokineospora guangxiensis]|uniref:PmoA family protein n=1 Tax=Actinokineospora guangxiensis TaxID=1490288 RepID=A0ABW0ESE6_9PSEU
MLATLTVAGTPVGRYHSGEGLPATLAPRPHLELTTLGGAKVTDIAPEDHRWHLGVGVAVQDVGGANLWGGRTYVRGTGYEWRDDHGSMIHTTWRELSDTVLDHDLDWLGPDGTAIVTEHRTVRAEPADDGYRFTFTFTLQSPAPVALGSPETNGREAAGYGGFFWRLPRPASEATVFTPDARGEHAVHGSPAPWIAYHGDDGTHPFTIALRGTDDETAADRWFVRQEGYPGIGSSIAPATVTPSGLTRRFTAVVLDGHTEPERVERLLAS